EPPAPLPPTYVAPPPSPAYAPPIPVEPPIKLAPIAPTRPADVTVRPTVAPAAFRGPVTRKAAQAAEPRKWTRAGGAALAVVCLVIAARAYYFSAPQKTAAIEELAAKPTVANAKGMGSLAIASEPPGARVTVDGKPRDVTPVTI